MAELPKSAREARLLGSTYYFTGRPCVHGHISKRMTVNWGCWRCLLDAATRRRKGRLEVERAKERAYYHAKRKRQRLAEAARQEAKKIWARTPAQ